MQSIWTISLIILWGVVLVNLLLTLRVVRQQRAIEDLRVQIAKREEIPELSIGIPAPDFKARKLSGEVVRLSDYIGQSVVFIFVSPYCGICRRKIPMLSRLSIHAQEHAAVSFILVSDSSSAETYTWINAIREEDGVEANLPILVAPRSTSEFLMTYNPRGFSPYYCFVDKEGIIKDRGRLDTERWLELQREWEGSSASQASSPFYHSRYR